MLGTDGIYFADGQVHPRDVWLHAANARPAWFAIASCSHWKTAVQKMTSIPAERFGLVDRGEVREGAFADLVVFDPATVTDRATYDDPHQLTVGIEHVVVNGREIVAANEAVSHANADQPGRALRYNCG